MTEESAPYEPNPAPFADPLTAIDECVLHVLNQVADGQANVAALIVYKDVQGNVTFMATGPGAVRASGSAFRFMFVEAAPEGCEPRLPS